MYQNPEYAEPDEGDPRDRARLALQDSYDWRDDRPQRTAAPAAARETRPQRDRPAGERRAQRPVSRTVRV